VFLAAWHHPGWCERALGGGAPRFAGHRGILPVSTRDTLTVPGAADEPVIQDMVMPAPTALSIRVSLLARLSRRLDRAGCMRSSTMAIG
jgi:hypothetical protein